MKNKMDPIKLLNRELYELEYSLQKSRQSFDQGSISEELHKIHQRNLIPKIAEYKCAIHILETCNTPNPNDNRDTTTGNEEGN